MITASDELYEVVSAIYEKHKGKPSISPAWLLATEGMRRISFPRELHPRGYRGCHMHLRQIARSFCRKKFDPTEEAENDLFQETLQERYPQRPKADEEHQYVLLDELTDDDGAYNVARMRRASLALQKHSDALEAYIIARQRAA
jgi:hypothetical protein